MEALSQREFDTWREGDNDFKDEMRSFIAQQVQFNLGHERRLSTVEQTQTDCSAESTKRATIISTVVTSVISGLVAVFTHGRG